jgi:hypothetical protein
MKYIVMRRVYKGLGGSPLKAPTDGSTVKKIIYINKMEQYIGLKRRGLCENRKMCNGYTNEFHCTDCLKVKLHPAIEKILEETDFYDIRRIADNENNTNKPKPPKG